MRPDAAWRPTIVVVDDDPLVLAYLEELLSGEGFHLVKAADAAQARAILAERVPDLLILDVAMPGGSGLELCREIRSRPELLALPIIVHTGSAELRRHSETDLYDFAFQKGTDPAALLRAIRAFMPDES